MDRIQEQDEEDEDKEEEEDDNTAPLPQVPKQNILLMRQKLNGKITDIESNTHMTAEMILYPDAYSYVQFDKLTGEEKNGGGLKYHNQVDPGKLNDSNQKQIYYEILPVDLHTFFSYDNFYDFRIRDSVQRPLYIERYFMFGKDGTIGERIFIIFIFQQIIVIFEI
ncbi:MAG: hypothetical protein EZS28_052224 [Streblomastix strix]|uniref:Uncharacterized protein n=1 Tax=Streblomastix strix TaxID=222440 RepID=A0A5J4SEP9_9EUKA|nr:MAG: hypothetical protein EZS28_052224 [Streblomastix strix]